MEGGLRLGCGIEVCNGRIIWLRFALEVWWEGGGKVRVWHTDVVGGGARLG